MTKGSGSLKHWRTIANPWGFASRRERLSAGREVCMQFASPKVSLFAGIAAKHLRSPFSCRMVHSESSWGTMVLLMRRGNRGRARREAGAGSNGVLSCSEDRGQHPAVPGPSHTKSEPSGTSERL